MAEKDIDDLLEVLRAESGCAFFSDLHDQHLRDRVHEAVLRTEAACFSAQTWCDALRYIIGEVMQTENPVEARDRLIRLLS